MRAATPTGPGLTGLALTALLLAGPAMAQAGSAAARDGVRKVAPSVLTVPGAVSPANPAAPAAAPVIEKPQTSVDRGQLNIMVDRAKVIRLPERTQTVVVGNPAIADMAIQKNGVVVVTGKSYGVTNLIALDGAGNLLAESVVNVSAPTDAVVVVQRGLERQSYSCAPNCQPSVVLGDANTYFSDNRGQADARNQFATSR